MSCAVWDEASTETATRTSKPPNATAATGQVGSLTGIPKRIRTRSAYREPLPRRIPSRGDIHLPNEVLHSVRCGQTPDLAPVDVGLPYGPPVNGRKGPPY